MAESVRSETTSGVHRHAEKDALGAFPPRSRHKTGPSLPPRKNEYMVALDAPGALERQGRWWRRRSRFSKKDLRRRRPGILRASVSRPRGSWSLGTVAGRWHGPPCFIPKRNVHYVIIGGSRMSSRSLTSATCPVSARDRSDRGPSPITLRPSFATAHHFWPPSETLGEFGSSPAEAGRTSLMRAHGCTVPCNVIPRDNATTASLSRWKRLLRICGHHKITVGRHRGWPAASPPPNVLSVFFEAARAILNALAAHYLRENRTRSRCLRVPQQPLGRAIGLQLFFSPA